MPLRGKPALFAPSGAASITTIPVSVPPVQRKLNPLYRVGFAPATVIRTSVQRKLNPRSEC